MSNVTTFLLSFILLLASCVDNNANERKQKIKDRLLEDPEHHIKASPNILKHDSTILHTGWYYVVDTANGYKRQLDKSDEIYYLDPRPIVTAKNFTTFEIYESSYKHNKYLGLTMWLDDEGTETWSNATLRAQGSKIAFILDNRLLQVAMVASQIMGGVTALNRGNYTRQELENFRAIIESEK